MRLENSELKTELQFLRGKLKSKGVYRFADEPLADVAGVGGGDARVYSNELLRSRELQASLKAEGALPHAIRQVDVLIDNESGEQAKLHSPSLQAKKDELMEQRRRKLEEQVRDLACIDQRD